MAAKLEWHGEWLMLGAFRMGRVMKATPSGSLRVFAVGAVASEPSEPYESLIDCMQDCEAEVRRLLREAGVEVEQ